MLKKVHLKAKELWFSLKLINGNKKLQVMDSSTKNVSNWVLQILPSFLALSKKMYWKVTLQSVTLMIRPWKDLWKLGNWLEFIGNLERIELQWISLILQQVMRPIKTKPFYLNILFNKVKLFGARCLLVFLCLHVKKNHWVKDV